MTASRTVFSAALRPCGSLGAGDDKSPCVGRLLAAPGEKSALPLYHVKHDAGKAPVCGGISCPGRRPKTTTRIASLSRTEAWTRACRARTPPLSARRTWQLPLSLPSGHHHRIVEPEVDDPENDPCELRHASGPEEKDCQPER